MSMVQESEFIEDTSNRCSHRSIPVRRMVSACTGVGAILLVGLLYDAGKLAYGYESKHVKSETFGSCQTNGSSFGTNWLRLREGQKLVITYETKISRGELLILVSNAAKRLDDPFELNTRIKQDEKGSFEIPIRQDGFYSIIFSASSSGRDRGYDMRYEATWKPADDMSTTLARD